MATYSERIRELRTMRGMSQQDLADLLDLNKVTISQYERGTRKPDLNVLTALSDIFNVSVDYILGNDDMTVRIVGKDGLEKLDRVPKIGQEKAPAWYINEETAKIAQEIFEDPNKRALFYAARDSRPEDLKMATDMLERFKETNPNG